MPSPRIISETSQTMVLPPEQEKKYLEELKNSVSNKTVTTPKPSTTKKDESSSNKKGQSKIKSFFGMPTSTGGNQKKRKEILDTPDLESQSNATPPAKESKEKKSLEGSTKTKTDMSKNSLYSEKLNIDSRSAIRSELKSEVESTPRINENKTSISLNKHFESSVKTPTPKVSRYSLDSTWMTPLSTPKESQNKAVDLSKFKATKTGNKWSSTPLQSSSSPALNSEILSSTQLEKQKKEYKDKSQSPLPSPTQIVSPIMTTRPDYRIDSKPAIAGNQTSHRDGLKRQYELRKENLLKRALEICVGEDFSSLDPLPHPSFSDANDHNDLFPDELVGHLAIHVQGRYVMNGPNDIDFFGKN